MSHPARHEVDEEHTLWIYYVTALDSGRYICTAQNQVGTTLAWASLSVQGKQRSLQHDNTAGLGMPADIKKGLSQQGLWPACAGE